MPVFPRFPLSTVRNAQYAGSWYDADGRRLNQQLNGYLEQAAAAMDMSAPYSGIADGSAAATAPDTVPEQSHLLAIIAPHAGYVYSGKTAAYSYALARKQSVKRIFILGPSHHLAVHGVALPAALSFATPLGDLEVDKTVIDDLSSYPLFSIQPEVHHIEHSLEMQLPYIKQMCPTAKIVPLVVGALEDESAVRLIAEILKGYIASDDLVVISSDFTHYGPRYEYTPFPSYERASVEAMDKEAFDHLARHDMEGFLDFQRRTQDTICGLYPCAVLCAMLPADARGHLLKYATSQDTVSEDKENAVSYLSISFTGSQWARDSLRRRPIEESIALSDEEKQTLIAIARKTLEVWVQEQRVIEPAQLPEFEITQAMKKCYGAFVTLYRHAQGNPRDSLRHEDKELRGCIGSIWSLHPLYQTVVENVIAAGSRDCRFTAVGKDELACLEIEISILTPPRRAASYKDIVLGQDGIILSKHGHQAVFLPSVATDFGWNLEETLNQLSEKAGLSSRDWQAGAKYDLFQSLRIEERAFLQSK